MIVELRAGENPDMLVAQMTMPGNDRIGFLLENLCCGFALGTGRASCLPHKIDAHPTEA